MKRVLMMAAVAATVAACGEGVTESVSGPSASTPIAARSTEGIQCPSAPPVFKLEEHEGALRIEIDPIPEASKFLVQVHRRSNEAGSDQVDWAFISNHAFEPTGGQHTLTTAGGGVYRVTVTAVVCGREQAAVDEKTLGGDLQTIAPPAVDKCQNIPGVQPSVPYGYYRIHGSCYKLWWWNW